MTAPLPPLAVPARILVVEDEWLIADMMKQYLLDAGFGIVGPADSVDLALDLLDSAEVSAAILDVNLGQETSFPIVDRLMARNIPFVLTTGYSPADLPPVYRSCRLLAKPLLGDALVTAVREILTITP